MVITAWNSILHSITDITCTFMVLHARAIITFTDYGCALKAWFLNSVTPLQKKNSGLAMQLCMRLVRRGVVNRINLTVTNEGSCCYIHTIYTMHVLTNLFSLDIPVSLHVNNVGAAT